jgi:hypothetical protein
MKGLSSTRGRKEGKKDPTILVLLLLLDEDNKEERVSTFF